MLKGKKSNMKQLNESKDLLSVSRREVKYLVSLSDRLYLLNALDQVLTPDAYGGYNGYTVRSVYFDSVANDDYIDKYTKEPEKKRIRMRVYHPDDKKVKFELKRKSYGRELKESQIITRDDAKRLLNLDYSVLQKYDSAAARYAYDLMTTRNYRPVSIIEYDRRAYTHENFNTRVTMDNNLRYCDFDYNLFSHNLNFKWAMKREDTILEIKYERFLFKQIQEILKHCDLTKKPPGKFATSRQVLREFYY